MSKSKDVILKKTISVVIALVLAIVGSWTVLKAKDATIYLSRVYIENKTQRITEKLIEDTYELEEYINNQIGYDTFLRNIDDYVKMVNKIEKKTRKLKIPKYNKNIETAISNIQATSLRVKEEAEVYKTKNELTDEDETRLKRSTARNPIFIRDRAEELLILLNKSEY